MKVSLKNVVHTVQNEDGTYTQTVYPHLFDAMEATGISVDDLREAMKTAVLHT